MSDLQIDQLIKECLGQNRGAQKKLYKTFYGFAMGICLRYSNNRNEAVQLMNIGFMKAFRNLQNYNRQYPFKAWLGKILVNISIDNYRRELKMASFEDSDAVDYVTFDEGAYRKLNYDDLLAMIQHLSPNYRIVFTLYVIEGYSHEEISKTLNIGIEISKSNLFKARLKLRSMIAKTYSLKRATDEQS